MKKMIFVLALIALSLTISAQTPEQFACELVANNLIEKTNATITSDEINDAGIRNIQTQLPDYYDIDLVKSLVGIVRDTYSDVTTRTNWTLHPGMPDTGKYYDVVLSVTENQQLLLITFYPSDKRLLLTFYFVTKK